MNDQSNSQEQNAPLAQWLYGLLASGPQGASLEGTPVGEDVSLPGSDYHAGFYPRIPNLVMALLQQKPEATIQFAPVIFHLLGCPVCHRAYLETYDAMRVALADETRPTTTTLHLPGSASLATTSPKLLVLLCQLLIGQARVLLQQAHREGTDEDAWARSLLQQSMGISRHIMQGVLRQRALRDLIEVASLAAPSLPSTDLPPPQTALSYAAQVGVSGSARGRIVRRAETAPHPHEAMSIELRSGSLEGSVTQESELLVLRLVGLAEVLRGHPLLISVPLGTLLEPVRWLGGNPYAIRSTGPVAADGTLVTPLGRTDLHIDLPEERNLLETLFKKLDVYPLSE